MLPVYVRKAFIKINKWLDKNQISVFYTFPVIYGYFLDILEKNINA